MDEKIDELSRAFKAVMDRAAQLETMVQDLSEKVQQQYDIMQSGGQA